MNILLGIDLGGTKIEGIAINAGCMNLQEICRLRIQTESELGYQHILQRLKEMAHMLAQKTGTKPSIIGLGHPGSEDPQTKTLKNSNTLCLNGQSLLQDLESALGIQVAAANDANCFALAESRFGAGRGAQIVFGVIMGTGVGGGIVVDGKVISGAQGIAGEWGHNVLDERGPRCYCGKSGCVETILSGPALERFYAARTGAQVPLKVIAEHAAKHTDDAAVETIERLCCYFGRAIAAVVNILDPDRIILGGGVSNIDALYPRAGVEAEKYVFNNRFQNNIVRHELGDSAGVIGAALLCEAQHGAAISAPSKR